MVLNKDPGTQNALYQPRQRAFAHMHLTSRFPCLQNTPVCLRGGQPSKGLSKGLRLSPWQRVVGAAAVGSMEGRLLRGVCHLRVGHVRVREGVEVVGRVGMSWTVGARVAGVYGVSWGMVEVVVEWGLLCCCCCSVIVLGGPVVGPCATAAFLAVSRAAKAAALRASMGTGGDVAPLRAEPPAMAPNPGPLSGPLATRGRSWWWCCVEGVVDCRGAAAAAAALGEAAE
eukprot:129122-Pelagomonas_calceolata.AAC.3